MENLFAIAEACKGMAFWEVTSEEQDFVSRVKFSALRELTYLIRSLHDC
jgi:hypothetical protein